MVFSYLLAFIFQVSAQSVCVDVKSAPGKVEPKKNAKIVAEYSKFTPLRMTGKKENRHFQVIDSDERTSWVKSSELTSNYSCAQVSVEKSRLRTGPGSEFPKSALAKKGQSFLDHGGEDGWTKVEDPDGNLSWIKLEHIWKPRSKVRMSFEAN